ncbi:MAG: OsmC family protein [Candidatus Omnitrophica bacterium]|nr:OsmC family protein [Candidatus Omnitrophota bacterium]
MELIVDYKGKMSFAAQCGNHQLIIDLPQTNGGADQGATPPQLFLVSLASCVGVYIASYCNNVGINTAGMQIKISAEKAHNPDRLDKIKVDVKMPNAELGKRKSAVLAVAKKCLIHNTIHNNPAVDIDIIAE